MKKYLTITTAIIFAVNAQTLLFAKDSSKTEVSDIAFEQLLNTKDFANLLSDNSSIALEKILLSPEQRAYNDLTKSLLGADKAKLFEVNILNVNKKAIEDMKYAQALPDAYYKIYKDILANPNISADFNLTKPELSKVIQTYEDKIVNLLNSAYSFKIEANQNRNLTLSAYLNKVINRNIALLAQYHKENSNVKPYTNQDSATKVNIKEHKDWHNPALHQEMLIKAAALRVIEANLKAAKTGLTYDLALFDIISISRLSEKETQINFGNTGLTLNIPQEAYKYIPFGTKKLVIRDADFITALQELEKKKQNPNYDFATKRDTTKQGRGHDYDPTKQPSIYDSPWGSGSVR